jgi:choline dehydrogenase-like flavoprotein
MGAKDINLRITPYPPPNLQAGGCRFGDNPKESVLNRNCQAHDIKNLFITDGSFMPTGGSLPYTWSIYANSFRVGEYIASIDTTLNFS